MFLTCIMYATLSSGDKNFKKKCFSEVRHEYPVGRIHIQTTLATPDPWSPLNVSHNSREMNLIWWKARQKAPFPETRSYIFLTGWQVGVDPNVPPSARGTVKPTARGARLVPVFQIQRQSCWHAKGLCVAFVPLNKRIWHLWWQKRDCAAPSDPCHMPSLEAVEGNVGDPERLSSPQSSAQVVRKAVAEWILTGSRSRTKIVLGRKILCCF